MSDFKKHLIFKVLTNFSKIPVNLGLNAIFPRLLGPANYGNFEFLFDNANKVIGFFDAGSSIAFYTKLSQNHRDQLLIKFYWYLVSSLATLYLLSILGVRLIGYSDSIWPNQSFYLVMLSAILGIVTFCSSAMILIMDACNITVRSEKMRMTYLLISLLIYGFVFIVFKTLSLTYFFYLQIFLIILLLSGSWFILHVSGVPVFPKKKIQIKDARKYGAYFWSFSNPLIVYAFVGLIVGIGARWILQEFGGSIQQAYFGLATRIGAFVLLFSSAIMPLLMREFARRFSENDFNKMSRLYVLSFKSLYLISMFIAILVYFNADFIVDLLGGNKFRKASEVLSLMAFYPVHQSLGQINSSLFYSTQRNKQYRNIGLFFYAYWPCCEFFFNCT